MSRDLIPLSTRSEIYLCIQPRSNAYVASTIIPTRSNGDVWFPWCIFGHNTVKRWLMVQCFIFSLCIYAIISGAFRFRVQLIYIKYNILVWVTLNDFALFQCLSFVLSQSCIDISVTMTIWKKIVYIYIYEILLIYTVGI